MDIDGTIITLLHRREPDASLCPSEVARALAPENGEWRTLMHPVREHAAALARTGSIVITQGSTRVDPSDIGKGPIRLRRGPGFPPSRQG